jgi:hypothetical protein
MAELTKEEKRLRNIEYAKNYPFLKEGLNSPVTIGNIGEYDGRVLINLAAKLRGKETNAVYSCPKSWAIATRYNTGDIVSVNVVGNEVVGLKPVVFNNMGARPAQITASGVNDAVEKKSALEKASEAVHAQISAEIKAKETPAPAKVEEPVAVVAEEDMPF